MKLSQRDKKLLVVVLLLVVVVVGYYYIFLPINRNIKTLNQEVWELKQKYSLLQIKASNKEKLLSEIKVANYQSKEIENSLPPFIEQERVILSLRELSLQTGLQIINPSFSRVVAVNAESDSVSAYSVSDANGEMTELLEQLKAASDNRLENILNEIGEVEEAVEAEEILAPSAIPDGTGIKMEVKITFEGTYAHLMNFLYAVNQYQYKVVASNITINGNQEKVSGGMSLSFYGIMDRQRSLTVWEQSSAFGKPNPFSQYNGYTGAQSTAGTGSSGVSGGESGQGGSGSNVETGLYDFYLVLNPVFSDVPSVILGKSDTLGSEVYNDGNRLTDLTIELNYSDGRYSFTYKTELGQYPASGTQPKTFVPVRNNEIVIMAVSTDITAADDKAGANIRIINNTDKKVIVEINKEKSGTRANIQFEGEGAVRLRE